MWYYPQVLHVSELSKSFGGQDILSRVSFAVSPGEKVALVGRNGCGKTTLLRILCGEESKDSGTVAFAPSCQLGYLGQEGQLVGTHSLYNEMSTAFANVKLLEADLRNVETQMSSCEDDVQMQALLNRYARLQDRFEHAEPHLIDAKIRTVLYGMGFRERDLDRECHEFSGGWQMRGAMARMLLREPDLLLLDEPTNHLDLQAVEWLENYLRAHTFTVLLVSHDRYFLDRVVNRTLELANTSIEEYPGNYSFYLEEREVRRELRLAAFQNQQKKLAQEMRFVERFRYKATLATRVQSRMKLIEKRELLSAPERDQRALKAKFELAGVSGREVLTIKNVKKSYGELAVLTGLSMELSRGERVSLVGANGVGKSTLLRLLAGLESPDGGTIRAGYKMAAVYYAQHQAEALDQTKTVLEEVSAIASRNTDQTRIRTILGCLLFEGDEVNKEISVLSGGERSRVALARCFLTPSNLLLLDEPTNHLDITAREALLDALEDYPGTILIVTHDRHFMNEISTSIIEIRDGQAYRYLGNYDAFQAKRRKEIQAEEDARQREQAKRLVPTKTQVEKKRKANQQQAGTKKICWKLEPLEKAICALEDELATITQELADPALYSQPAAGKEKQALYDKKQGELSELTSIWEEMVEEQGN